MKKGIISLQLFMAVFNTYTKFKRTDQNLFDNQQSLRKRKGMK